MKGKPFRSMTAHELAILMAGPNQAVGCPQEPQGGDSSGGSDSVSYTPTSRPTPWPFKASAPKPKPLACPLADKIAYKAPVLAPWPEHVDLREHELTPV
jgi:hypothetical protein